MSPFIQGQHVCSMTADGKVFFMSATNSDILVYVRGWSGGERCLTMSGIWCCLWVLGVLVVVGRHLGGIWVPTDSGTWKGPVCCVTTGPRTSSWQVYRTGTYSVCPCSGSEQSEQSSCSMLPSALRAKPRPRGTTICIMGIICIIGCSS